MSFWRLPNGLGGGKVVWLLPSQTEGKDVFEQRGGQYSLATTYRFLLLKQEA